LVFYNNSTHYANVTVNSCLYAERASGITEALQLSTQSNQFVIYRDNVSNLEYIKNSLKLGQAGFQIELGAYGRAVLLDWREIADTDGRYARLEQMLGGRGVEHIETAVQELYLEKILTPWNNLVNSSHARALLEPSPLLFGELEAKAKALSDGIELHTKKELSGDMFAVGLRSDLESIKPSTAEIALEQLALATLKRVAILTEATPQAVAAEWLLERQLTRAFRDLSNGYAQRSAARVLLLTANIEALEEAKTSADLIEFLILDLNSDLAIGLNTFEAKRYVHAEAFAQWIVSASRNSSQSKLLEKTEAAVIDIGYCLDLLASPSKKVTKAVKKTTVAKPKKPAKTTKKKAATPVPSSSRKGVLVTTKTKASTKPTITKATVGATELQATGVNPAQASDDLTRIEGIGPKIASALSAANITSFSILAASDNATLKTAIQAAKIRLAPSLETWAEQASFLARGDEVGFAALIGSLVAGRKVKKTK
jgi:predicted flap endonuclease-1-like 5' DNA nuclease